MPYRLASRTIPALLFCIAFAQEPLTNASIKKLTQSGFTEDVILQLIRSQPGQFSVAPDDLVALRDAGISQRVLQAMIEQSGRTLLAKSGEPADAGVYFKKGEQWLELHPEIVHWKTGGTLKQMAALGYRSADLNGRIVGASSRTRLNTPIEILINTLSGVQIEEYILVRFRPHDDAREFRIVTGGVFHQSSGAMRDQIPFQADQLGPRRYRIRLESLKRGGFGLLPPGAVNSAHASGSVGKAYTFQLLE